MWTVYMAVHRKATFDSTLNLAVRFVCIINKTGLSILKWCVTGHKALYTGVNLTVLRCETLSLILKSVIMHQAGYRSLHMKIYGAY
jgi:hypothetical protein